MARLNRGQTMAVFVSIIVVALLVMVWRWTAEEEMSDAGEIELLVDTVGRQTLRDELTLNGDRILRKEGWVKDGDRLVQIAGTVRQAGLTNTMSIREM